MRILPAMYMNNFWEDGDPKMISGVFLSSFSHISRNLPNLRGMKIFSGSFSSAPFQDLASLNCGNKQGTDQMGKEVVAG